MLRRLARATVTTVLAAGLSLGSAVAADAQNLTVRDARGDMVSLTESVDGATTQTPAPEVSNGDIVRSVFRHERRRISVRVKFADLERVDGLRMDVVQLVTNERLHRDVLVVAGPGMRRGDAQMSAPRRDVRCRGLRWRIDYDLNVVRVSFPRSCVSNPRWIKVGMGSALVTELSNPDPTSGALYLDDAQRSGSVSEYRMRWSPRLHRG